MASRAESSRSAGLTVRYDAAMAVTWIDDSDDPRLSDYRNIPDADLLSRRGVFIAEGRLVVTRLLAASSMTARSVMVTKTAYAAIRPAVERHPALPVFVVSQAAMNAVSGFNIHRGCLAVGERPAARDPGEMTRGARRLLVLERIGNVDNVGALFRSGAAFGVDGVLLDAACADPLYRKAIRTSMGAALVVPYAVTERLPDTLCELRAAGHAIVGMTPATEAAPLREVAAAVGSRPFAVVLGHEGEGLAAHTLERCEYLARIPMQPGTDSLNVATAGAIALYALAAA